MEGRDPRQSLGGKEGPEPVFKYTGGARDSFRLKDQGHDASCESEGGVRGMFRVERRDQNQCSMRTEDEAAVGEKKPET